MDSFVYVASYGHGGFKVVVVTVLLIVLQCLVVGGRFTSRRLRKVSLGTDDYVLLLATALTFGLCALAIACKLIYRLDRIFDLEETDPVGPVPRIAGIGAHIGENQMKTSPEGKLLGQVSSNVNSLIYYLTLD